MYSYVRIVVLAGVLSVVANAKLLTPRDLTDEVLEQLQELSSIVQGEIFAGHDDIDNMRTNFDTEAMEVMQTGSISLDTEHGNIDSSLNSIKDLANSANADISECTNEVEGVLIRLPRQYQQQLSICTFGVTSQADRIATDARYTVDVVINKVNQLEFQINQCGPNLVCLSPLMTEIELDKIRLPQSIRTETESCDNLLTTLKLSVDSCTKDAVSQYVSHAGSLLNQIVTCVNRLLS